MTLEERLAFGPAYQDQDFIFAREDGAPVHPKRLSDAFDRHIRALPVQRIRFHDLRHTFATLALQAGVNPKVVSEILGHANIGITLDTYSHAVPSMQEEATERVSDLIFGSP
jgi:integrase